MIRSQPQPRQPHMRRKNCLTRSSLWSVPKSAQPRRVSHLETNPATAGMSDLSSSACWHNDATSKRQQRGDGMAVENTQLRGSCLCGLVVYEVSDAFEYSLYCHCSDCRRATGAASKPFAGIASRCMVVAQGEDHIMRHGDEKGHNAHCGRCGSLLYSLVRNGTYVHVTLGTLIDVPTISPSAHIFVSSKAPWETIGDGLPQFDRFPPN